MKRQRIKLRVNLEHGAIPIEIAMAAAGFHQPDANAKWLSGYYPLNGIDRYHEAATPPVLSELANGTFDLSTVQAPDHLWVEVEVVFRCTYQEAEPPPCPSSTTKKAKRDSLR